MTRVSIVDFGAKAGEKNPQTDSIQAAIDACFLRGGGEVIVPTGEFQTGAVRLRSGVCLHLMRQAHLIGVRDPEQYDVLERDKLEPLAPEQRTEELYIPPRQRGDSFDYAFMKKPGSRWNHGLIRALGAKHISIIGEEDSSLDGSDCFDELGEESYRGPHLINMFDCEDVRFEGYTCLNSANWAHALFFCKNIVMEGVRVLAGHDGIHISGCDNVIVRSCSFHTGDDCVAGFDNQNVTVAACELNTACSGLRFGGTNLIVSRCSFFGPADYLFRGSLTDAEKRSGTLASGVGKHRYNMLSVFTYYADHSLAIREQPGNIEICDCRISGVDRLLHYNYSGNETWQQNRPLRSVSFRRVTVEDLAMPLIAYGDAGIPAQVSLENARIAFRPGYDGDFMHACCCDWIMMRDVRIDGIQEGALVRTWGGTDRLWLDRVDCGLPEDQWLKAADKPFSCRPI